MTTPAAINLLPPEVLAHVFDQSGYTFSKDHAALLRLTAVCKHWRDVIYNHPHFWSSLDRTIRYSQNTTSTNNNNDDDTHSLERWFKHAGDSPRSLNLRFDRAPRTSVREHVFRYLRGSSQWRSLVLKCGPGPAGGTGVQGVEDASAGWIQTLLPRRAREHRDPALEWSGDLVPVTSSSSGGGPCWPALEEFEVHAAGAQYPAGTLAFPLAYEAPSLQKFAFTAKAIEGSLFNVFADFSWGNLTHFDLWTAADSDGHPAFILHVLEQAPGLEDLRVVLLPNRSSSSSPTSSQAPAPICPNATAGSPGPVTRHQNLKHLGVHVAPGAVMALLKQLQLPSLASLDIATRAYGRAGLTETSGAFVDEYRAFLVRSGCEMKTLHLQWVPRNIEEFNETIGGSRTLESVELEDFGCYGEDASVQHPMFGFCKLLQGCKEKGQDPLAGLKKLSYVTYGFGVKLEEGEEDFEVLRSEPINWWRYKRFGGMKVSGVY